MDAHESTDEVDLFMIATPSIRGPNKGSSSNIDALNSYDEALAEAEFQSAASPPPLTKAEQRKLRAKKRKEFSREQRKERVKRKKENEHEESGLVTAKHVAETSYFFRDGTCALAAIFWGENQISHIKLHRIFHYKLIQIAPSIGLP